jgi:RHS repeat-associated protein
VGTLLSQARSIVRVAFTRCRAHAAVRRSLVAGFCVGSALLLAASPFNVLTAVLAAVRTNHNYLTITAEGSAPDTVVVFGPKQFVTVKAKTQVNFVESFSVPVSTPENPTTYTMRLKRVGGVLSTATVMVNGKTVALAADFATATYIERLVTVNSGSGNTNTLSISLKGDAGAGLIVTIVGTPNSSYSIFGPKAYAKTATTPTHYVDSFVLPTGAAKPYRISAKASVTGTKATITLNGVKVIIDKNFVGTTPIVRDVNLVSGNNSLVVDVRGTTGTTITVEVTATDKNAPVLTITSPQQNLVTNAATIAVTGTSQDTGPTTVKVNGIAAIMSGAGNTQFSATVALTEGINVIAIVAKDLAGNHTDSTRTVTRDTQAPTLALTTPADGSFTNQSATTVSGTASGGGTITVKVNGVSFPVGAGGAFSGSFELSPGANFLTAVATDQAGNSASVTNKVTLDTDAPVVTIATPAEGAITKETSIAVSGTVADASAATLTVNGVSTPVGTDGGFSATITLASEGANAISVVATDAASNQSTASRNVVRDTQAPVVTITAPAEGFLTNTSSVSVSGTVTDATTVTLTANGVALTVDASGNFTGEVPLAAEGANAIAFIATDAATNQSTTSRNVVRDTQAPVLNITGPTDNLVTKTNSVSITGDVYDASSVAVSVNGAPLIVDGAGMLGGSVTLAEGANILNIVATDGAGNSATQVRHVTLDTEAPVVSVTEPADGANVTTETISVSGSVTDATAVTLTVNGTSVSIGADGSFSTSVPLSVGANSIVVVTTDAATNSSTVTRSVTRTAVTPPTEGPPEALPPDPAVHAPPVAASVATTPAAAGAFLYTGANPLQTGVVSGTIEAQRGAILRGRVLGRDMSPLDGVEVTIVDHPEFGRTETRASGQYDMAVNGGGALTIRYAKAGVLDATRREDVPWQDYVVLDDVILVALDQQVTTVDLSGGTAATQVARGNIQTDADGARQATVLFPQGTTATMVLPDGTTQPLSSLHVRATEYTVGENGRSMMPAPLPPTSAYTYAVELSVDEARTAGATSVKFSQPVPFYVENFLGFPVGLPVPVGVLDRERGVWVPDKNGVIIGIVSKTNGMADVDTDGDGAADTPAALLALGITDEERARLDSLYETGRSLWRVSLTHFTTFDLNYSLVKQHEKPEVEPIIKDGRPKVPCKTPARSTIECQTQVLGEQISLPGTPFTLHYQSDRASGRTLSHSIDIPLTESSLPDGLRRVVLDIEVAGRRFVHTRAPLPNLTHAFVWDGKDAYGRDVAGGQPITVKLTYVYDQLYAIPPTVARSFGLTCRGEAYPGYAACFVPSSINSRARQEDIVTGIWQGELGSFGTGAAGLGGWTLDVHHAYDFVGQELYTGGGHRRRAEAIGAVSTAVAGTGVRGISADGGPATAALLDLPFGVAAAPDGVLYVCEYGNGRLVRIGKDGVLTTVLTDLLDPGPMVTDAAGRVYFIAYNAFYNGMGVYRYTPGLEGGLERIAGGGHDAPADGLPATQIRFTYLTDVAVGPDGSVYIADADRGQVWRMGTDGLATRFAGTGGPPGFGGEGGRATAAQFWSLYAVAVAPNGDVYIADEVHEGAPPGTEGGRIRRVGADGIITTLAGNLDGRTGADGDLATDQSFYGASTMAVGPEGLYFADINAVRAGVSGPTSNRIFLLRPDGTMIRVAGGGGSATTGLPEGSLATRVSFDVPWSISRGPDGTLYIADATNHRVWGVHPPLPGIGRQDIAITTEDGTARDVFNAAGLHMRTTDALTGVTLLQFGYDSGDRLTTVTDADGNVTTIERDGSGKPLAVVAPFGQRSELALDANGLLARVTNAAGEAIGLTYHPGGLLATVTNPKGAVSRFTYDQTGLLIRDEDPMGGFINLARTEFKGGWVVSQTSALGRTTTYRVESSTSGGEVRVNTSPDGLSARTIDGTDGKPITNSPDGTITAMTLGPDPRFGMQSPIPNQVTTQTPGGLLETVTGGRRTVLSDAANPLSLVSALDSLVVNGRIFRSGYVAATRTFTATTPIGRSSTGRLDALGRLIEEAAPGITPVQYQYDAHGLLAQVSQGSRQRNYGYDARGRVATTTDALLRSSQYFYDASDRLTREVLADGREVLYAHDLNGNLQSLTPPGRPAHRFQYNSLNLLTSYDPPSVGAGSWSTTYQYNLDRKVTKVVRPSGQTIGFGYDASGRPTTLTVPGGAMRHSYDPASGILISASGAYGGTLSFSFDGSLLTGTTWSGEVAGAVTATYDNDFQVTGLSVNGASPVAFAYDGDGLLSNAGALTISRSATNRLVLGTALGAVTTSQSYTPLGEVSHFAALLNNNALLDMTYGQDAVGRISEVTQTIGGVTTVRGFTYDLTGRLSEIRDNGSLATLYEYDVNGNRARVTTPNGVVTGTYDDQDRLLTYGSASYSYTPDGELSTKTVGSDATHYQYDVLGNLRHVGLPDGTLIDYVVDGMNRRVGKKVNGVLVQGFLYQGQLSVIAELDATGNVRSRFVYGSRKSVPDYMVKNGIAYRLISDRLGSVRLVVNAMTGAVAQRIDYDEWGNVTLNTNPGFQPLGFAGGLYDEQTKLVRFGARDYDASIGRWTARDPADFGGGDLNLYRYASGDPVNVVDRSGLGDDCPKCHLSKAGLDFIKSWEKFSADIYPDEGGRPTIGYGHLIMKGETITGPITEQEALDLLDQDIAQRANGVQLIEVPLSQNEYDALVSFAFNIGRPQFSRATLLKRVNEGDYDAVPNELAKYVMVGKTRSRGLERRRAAEIKIFNRGGPRTCVP